MLLQRLALKNVLSFKESTVELGPLNVLIGPNAVGKSNLIEAISLLQGAPTGLSKAILRGGGIRQWLWLGLQVPSLIASLECRVRLSSGRQQGTLDYGLSISEDATGFVITDERLVDSTHGTDQPEPEMYFHRTFKQAGRSCNFRSPVLG